MVYLLLKKYLQIKMSTLIKTTASEKTKKHFLSFLLFSIAVFITCSIIVTVFHNDSVKHETHPINHSPVCQWINEGKLCSHVSLAITPFFSFITTFCIFTTGLLLTEKYKENNLQLNHLFLGSALTSRAPPTK